MLCCPPVSVPSPLARSRINRREQRDERVLPRDPRTCCTAARSSPEIVFLYAKKYRSLKTGGREGGRGERKPERERNMNRKSCEAGIVKVAISSSGSIPRVKEVSAQMRVAAQCYVGYQNALKTSVVWGQ